MGKKSKKLYTDLGKAMLTNARTTLERRVAEAEFSVRNTTDNTYRKGLAERIDEDKATIADLSKKIGEGSAIASGGADHAEQLMAAALLEKQLLETEVNRLSGDIARYAMRDQILFSGNQERRNDVYKQIEAVDARIAQIRRFAPRSK